MKKLLLFTVLCGLFALPARAPAQSPAQSPAVYFVQKGQPRAAIVLPDDSPAAVTLAAHELQSYLQKISGARLEIVPRRPASGVAIDFKILPDDPQDPNVHDTFILDAKEDGLTISGHSDVAVLYGAYQLLNNLGVSWFSPGEIGENVPQSADIKINLGATTYRPALRTRVIDYSGTNDSHFGKENQAQQHEEFDLWLLRNKLQFYRTIHKEKRNPHHKYDFGWAREFSTHNIRRAALAPIDGKVALERYPLVTIDGVPTRATEKIGRGTQICFTAQQNIESAIQSALDYFQQNPDFITYSLSLQDSHGLCDCENCIRANNGVLPSTDPNRVVWKFMNAVAKGLGEKAPGKRIAFYATYSDMTRPPLEIQAQPNVVAVTCHVTSQARPIEDPGDPYNAVYLDNIRLVKASGAELGSYDYLMYAGNPQPLTVLEDVQTYHKMGYSWLAAEWMGRDEQRYAVAWVLAQMAWDAGQNPRALLEKYCNEYYGAAGPAVLSLFDLVESRVRSLKRITLGGFSTTSLMLTPAVVEQARALLKAAAAQTKGRDAERVRRLSLTFEMWNRAVLVERAYKRALDERTPAARQKVLDEVASFTKFWNENHLDQICSPVILDRSMQGYVEKTNAIKAEIEPAASKKLAGATRAQLIDALFSHAGADFPTLRREAQQTTAPQRRGEITLLPEIWKFKIDPDDDGASSFATYRKKAPPWGKPQYDDSRWAQLSTYNVFDRQGFADYKGVFWYRLKFVAPDFKPGESIWLRFGGLDDDGAIYVNGVLVGEREGVRGGDWETSFAYDVTKRIKPGQENLIAVRGLNLAGAGGLWKPVGLYARYSE